MQINYGSSTEDDFIILGYPFEEGRFRECGKSGDSAKTPSLLRKYLEKFPSVRPSNSIQITQTVSDVGNISSNLPLESAHTLLADFICNIFKIKPLDNGGNNEQKTDKNWIIPSYRKVHKKIVFIAGGAMDMLMPSVYGLHQSDLMSTSTFTLGIGKKQLIVPTIHVFLISPDIPNMPLILGKVHAGCQLRLLNECPGMNISSNVFGVSECSTDINSVENITKRGGSVYFDTDCIDSVGNTQSLLNKILQVISKIKIITKQKKNEYLKAKLVQFQYTQEQKDLHLSIDNENFEIDMFVLAIDMRVLKEGILSLSHLIPCCDYFASDSKCKMILISDSDNPHHVSKLCWSALCGAESR